MNQEGDDLVTRLTKWFAFLLVLILSFPQVLAAKAAEPFSKDALSIPSLDENTAIYAGTWVADSEEQAFLLLGNEKVMWLAVATQTEDGAYQLIAQSKPVLSYETYCSGSVEMTDRWDDGVPYFGATPYNGVQIKRNILESGRSQGCPLKSLPGQTTIRLPDKVCQPGSGLPEQTSCSVLQSVFAALGSGSYKTRAAALPQQKHVPLWRVRRISRVLCV